MEAFDWAYVYNFNHFFCVAFMVSENFWLKAAIPRVKCRFCFEACHKG